VGVNRKQGTDKKVKMKIIKVGLTIFLMFTFFCCSSQKTEWQGSIEVVDGVSVVKNPKEPMYGEIILELEEDLNIGNDRDENYQFYQVYFIIPDSHKNIYILDGGNHRVQKYDKNGNYLQTIGRKGQGPGEFTSLYSAFIDGQDNLYVSEGRRIQVFNALGEYQRSILLDNNINEFFVDFKGNIITHATLRNEEGSKKVILKMNPKGKVLEKIVEFADVTAVQKKDSGGTTLQFTPEIIQKDCLYDIYTSEETGKVLIKRYKIKNWEQIKKVI
jgi:hypothetical protein